MNETNGRGKLRFFELAYVVGLAILLIYAIFFMNPHRVGVLDVARVARETGVLERMQKEERGLQEEARERLGKLQQAHILKVNELGRKLKSAASESEKSRFQGEIDSLQETFQQTVSAARQELQRHEAQMFATFRKRLMPHVEKVASKRRLDVVLDPATTVLITKKAPDITADVVKAVRDVFLPTQPLIDLSLIETRPLAGKWAGTEEDRSEEPLAAPAHPVKTRQEP